MDLERSGMLRWSWVLMFEKYTGHPHREFRTPLMTLAVPLGSAHIRYPRLVLTVSVQMNLV